MAVFTTDRVARTGVSMRVTGNALLRPTSRILQLAPEVDWYLIVESVMHGSTPQDIARLRPERSSFANGCDVPGIPTSLGILGPLNPLRVSSQVVELR